MSERAHDLRGRDFRWEGSSGEIRILEDPIEVGHLVRVPDARPVFFAEFAGRRWRIDHSAMAVGPVFSVSDPDTGAVIGRSHYTPSAELRLQTGGHVYSLRQPSPSLTTWHDGQEDVTTFRQTGEAFVLWGCDPADAPSLLLLGIVMAVENSLFLENRR